MDGSFMIKNELVGKYWKAHKERRDTDGSLSKEEMADQAKEWMEEKKPR